MVYTHTKVFHFVFSCAFPDTNVFEVLILTQSYISAVSTVCFSLESEWPLQKVTNTGAQATSKTTNKTDSAKENSSTTSAWL